MIDLFETMHARFTVGPSHRAMRHTFVRDCIEPLMKLPFVFESTGLLGKSTRTEPIELSLAVMAEELIFQLKLPELMTWERVLVEAVALYRIQQHIFEGNLVLEQDRTMTIAFLGAMVQHRLTIAFIDLPDCDRLSVLAWKRRFFTSFAECWVGVVIGATSVIKTILMASMQEDVRIYLPSLKEDVVHATDLYLVNDQCHFALSVKTAKSFFPIGTLLAQDPLPEEGKPYREDLMHLRHGVHWASVVYARVFKGLLVSVKASDDIISFTHSDEHVIDLYQGMMRALEPTSE